MKMFSTDALQKMSNEEIAIRIEELSAEKDRRNKISRQQAVVAFRDALKAFLDSGANHDFHRTCVFDSSQLANGQIDIYFQEDSCRSDYDIDTVEFDAFNSEVLSEILDELNRCIGNYEG